MEITEFNLITDFEAGIKCLQNPSLISKLPQLNTFWTYGALILAVFATFTNIFNNIKLFINHLRLKFLTSCQNNCPQKIFNDDDFDFDFSDDGDEDDDTPSSVAESEDVGFESEKDRVTAVFRAEGSSYWGVNEEQGEGQDGNFTLRQRRNGFSWSDFSAGKSVVQLWDSFGLGLDFEDYDDEYENDYVNNMVLRTGGRCHVAMGVVGENDGGVYAAWRPRQREIWLDENGVVGVGEKEE